MKKRIEVLEHGVAMRARDNVFGYYGWPSVAVNDQGELIVAASGHRVEHVCPFGKVITRISRDEGKSWFAPMIAIDTCLDDRDSGIVNVGGGKMLLTTFNNDRDIQRRWAARPGLKEGTLCNGYLDNITDEMENRDFGSLMSISYDNGYSWSEPYKVPVSAPHGPCVTKDGTVLYAGSPYFDQSYVITKERPWELMLEYPISVYASKDYQNFEKIADIPICPEIGPDYDYCEPHILELPSGRLLLLIRVDQFHTSYENGIKSCVQTVSDDGGKTWSPPKLVGCKHGPPHLLQHSSGTLIATYGRRIAPFGVSAMFSDDEGETWDMDHAVWDGGVDGDLGYPCSVELENGDIFTVYYGKVPGDTKTSVMWTRWKLV